MSQSDTEVLLKAYGPLGRKCVGELRGMFAFAIWMPKSRLLLSRDPMGIKPAAIVPRANISCLLRLRTLLGTGWFLDGRPRRLINYQF